MTATTVYNEVLSAIGLSFPSPSVVSTDPSQMSVVSFINRAGKDIAVKAEWPRLLTRAALPREDVGALLGYSKFVLPPDFGSLAVGGLVTDENTGEVYEGVVNTALWSVVARVPATDVDTKYFFIHGDSVLTNYADIGVLSVEYVSTGWVRSGDEEFDTVQAASDEFNVPEVLVRDGAIWRWRRQNSYDYQSLQEEFDENLLILYNDAKGST